jgi:hypothetical protein
VCSECGEFYPAFKHEGELVAVGRNGSCEGGDGALEPVTDTMLDDNEGRKTAPVP